MHAATLGATGLGAARPEHVRLLQQRGAELGVGQLVAAEAELEELDEVLDVAPAAAFAGAVVVGEDEESLDDAAGVDVEAEDDVPADTVDFDFERESLR
ncbi:hypothetical protein [Cellulomonas sp. WB94]|uniref:hypothetical protein n=1 Tax=Cellulomonas sp. WB94 TaxID=2173174 RepID=UPI00269F5462